MSDKYVVCALDAFKGTLTSYRGGEAVELAFRRFQQKAASQRQSAALAERPIATPQTPLQFIHSPMSDGGAGLLDSLTYVPAHKRRDDGQSATALTAQFERVFVPSHVRLTGPLGTPLTFRTPAPGEDASVGVSFACDVAHRVVVIEMAEASGLPRIAQPSQRSPARTTSYGTGELIAYSLQHMQAQLDAAPRNTSSRSEADDDYGVSVYVGIGGSATNDGGLGALQALGLRIYVAADKTAAASSSSSAKETLLTRPFTGADLARVTRVEADAAMRALFFHSGRCVGDAATAPPRRRAYVKQIYLICDVNNPLTGPRGATFIFGPQKCAPVPKSATASAEDAPVGEVGSEAQMQMLRGLEQGMCNAATRVVASLWRGHQQLRSVAAACGGGGAAPTHDAQLQQLMHGIGGGGAGGMSGFFHYVLGAAWLPGADAVAALLGLRNNDNNDSASTHGGDEGVTAAAKGLLYSKCSIVVSGEGSFDTQTIYYRKTVGRLLEMAVEANVWRLAQYARAHPDCDVMQTDSNSGAAAPSLIDDFVVVCGRCGFKSIQSCRADVLQVLRRRLLPAEAGADGKAPPRSDASEEELKAKLQALTRQLSRGGRVYSAAAVLQRVLPRVTVLPLSPAPFTVRQAMTDTYNCVLHRIEGYLTETYTGVSSSSNAKQDSKL